MEPTPAQRKDSVLRRDMKGSALSFCSATHAHKLINFVEPGTAEPRNSLSLAERPFRSRFISIRLIMLDFNRLGVKGSVESLSTAWTADFRV